MAEGPAVIVRGGVQAPAELFSPRARRMRDRVVRAASDIGLGPEDIARLVRAYTAAMSVRESGPGALASDLDPDFLHPGRTVLILLDDVRERDVFVLAAGALAESRNAELRLSPDAAEEILGDAAGLWRALPSVEWNRVSEAAVPQGGQDAGDTDDERILEELVSAPLAVQRIALAEALDHVRHAHLWARASEQRRAVALTRRVLQPVAARADAVLNRRYLWWVRRVGPALDRAGPSS